MLGWLFPGGLGIIIPDLSVVWELGPPEKRERTRTPRC